jgi:hypothetical protein
MLILPRDHPGLRSEDAEVGENMLILPLGWSEAAAGGGWENDCDLKHYGTAADVGVQSAPPSVCMFRTPLLLPGFLRRATDKAAVGHR